MKFAPRMGPGRLVGTGCRLSAKASCVMRLIFRRAAERALDRIPADRRRQLLSRIESLAADPTRHSANVKPLVGSDLFRLRVGDYRVLFSLDEAAEVLTVDLIRTRGDVYKR